jgi:hypothetical protein
METTDPSTALEQNRNCLFKSNAYPKVEAATTTSVHNTSSPRNPDAYEGALVECQISNWVLPENDIRKRLSSITSLRHRSGIKKKVVLEVSHGLFLMRCKH